jgi:hypothetical protein
MTITFPFLVSRMALPNVRWTTAKHAEGFREFESISIIEPLLVEFHVLSRN